MAKIPAFLRRGLSLFLSFQLGVPSGLWAASEGRDLEVIPQVKTFREEAALWVLSIGVSRYANERISLRYADHDAVKIAQMLKIQEGLLFREVFTRVLVNEDATREKILNAMSRFLGQASENDVVLVFLAGHGLQDRQTGTYYFLPHNARAENLVFAGLPMPMFEEVCKRIRTHVNKLVLWLDTCHAGAVSGPVRGVTVGEDLSEALAQAEGLYWLSASKAGEESYEGQQYRFEGEDQGHGAFTYSILRGLQGKAADDDGVVWISDLFGHVSKEVPRVTEGQQHPHSRITGTNLPLFVVDETVYPVMGQPIYAIGPGKTQKSSRKWLWLLLGAAAIGGGAVVISRSGDEGAPGTGRVEIEVPVP